MLGVKIDCGVVNVIRNKPNGVLICEVICLGVNAGGGYRPGALGVKGGKGGSIGSRNWSSQP